MEWIISTEPLPYLEAVAFMEARVQAIRAGTADELVWLLEHPPLYTAGTSAQSSDLVDARFPVFQTGRGGQYTYHGPGQRIGYVMLDLNKRGADLRAYVQKLEAWLIDTLAAFGVTGEIREGRVGVWVKTAPQPLPPTGASYPPLPQAGEGRGEGHFPPASKSPHLTSPASGRGIHGGEAKIAALGVRVRKWVTYHGVALNVTPDLSHYAGIVPCGIREFGVTSLAALGKHPAMAEVDVQLQRSFEKIFDDA